MAEAANPTSEGKYAEFAAFLDSVLTQESAKPDAAGKPLAINFRDMEHPDAGIREALGSPEVIGVLKKYGIKTFIPEGPAQSNIVMDAFRKSRNEEDVRKALGTPYHTFEPEKAKAWQDAQTNEFVKPQEAGINVVFADARYKNFTQNENELLSTMAGSIKSVECTPVTAEAAVDLLEQQGKMIDVYKFAEKIAQTDVLHQNATDTTNAATLDGKPENFYTLQGMMHSEQSEGNPVTFTQMGFNVIDMALAPAETDHLGFPKATIAVPPQYLYSLRTNEALSGRDAQDKYMEVRQAPKISDSGKDVHDEYAGMGQAQGISKTKADCIAELPIALQDALKSALFPSSQPQSDVPSQSNAPSQSNVPSPSDISSESVVRPPMYTGANPLLEGNKIDSRQL